MHITSNNTIAGTQWHEFPDTGSVPLVADMSSDIMWRPIDVSKFGLIYAGAQKNLGPSGIAVVIVRKDLIENGRKDIPKIFQYRTHADAGSLYNTPPTLLGLPASQRARGGQAGRGPCRHGEEKPPEGGASVQRDRRTPRLLPVARWTRRAGR